MRDRGLGPELSEARAPGIGARTLLGKPTAFVGREWETSSVLRLFGEVAEAGAARAMLVTAPAGMGKSRLAYEAVSAIRSDLPGVEVWSARGDVLRAGSAFGMLGQAVLDAVGSLPSEAPEVAVASGAPRPTWRPTSRRARGADPSLAAPRQSDFVAVRCRSRSGSLYWIVAVGLALGAARLAGWPLSSAHDLLTPVAAGFGLAVIFILLGESTLGLSRYLGLRLPDGVSPGPVVLHYFTFGLSGIIHTPAALTGPADRQKQPQEKTDPSREIIETVVFVVVLVLMLKSFVAEAFVIPTGSMAETLCGYQKVVTCPKCRLRFPRQLQQRSRSDRRADRKEITGCTCPNCRQEIGFTHAVTGRVASVLPAGDHGGVLEVDGTP